MPVVELTVAAMMVMMSVAMLHDGGKDGDAAIDHVLVGGWMVAAAAAAAAVVLAAVLLVGWR